LVTTRSFTADLEVSLLHTSEDIALLAAHFGIPPSHVRKTSEEEDKAGVDYEVTLSSGERATVDMKRRLRGACRWWKRHTRPEAAIELWCGGRYGHPGALFRSEPLPTFWAFYFEDTSDLFVLPTDVLRATAERFMDEWTAEFGTAESLTQNQDGTSSATLVCFVPTSRLLADMRLLTPEVESLQPSNTL
jgi:hypothetical protein